MRKAYKNFTERLKSACLGAGYLSIFFQISNKAPDGRSNKSTYVYSLFEAENVVQRCKSASGIKT